MKITYDEAAKLVEAEIKQAEACFYHNANGEFYKKFPEMEHDCRISFVEGWLKSVLIRLVQRTGSTN